jgi:hypothetical protein
VPNSILDVQPQRSPGLAALFERVRGLQPRSMSVATGAASI